MAVSPFHPFHPLDPGLGVYSYPAESLPAVNFELLRADAFLPIQATDGSACFDLCAADPVTLTSSCARVTINTGVRAELPHGHVGLICSRSGLAANKGVFVLNAPGIIDADYKGELKVILARHEFNADWSDIEPIHFSPGDRVAQLLVLALPGLSVLNIRRLAAERGAGGLGSTGIS